MTSKISPGIILISQNNTVELAKASGTQTLAQMFQQACANLQNIIPSTYDATYLEFSELVIPVGNGTSDLLRGIAPDSILNLLCSQTAISTLTSVRGHRTVIEMSGNIREYHIILDSTGGNNKFLLVTITPNGTVTYTDLSSYKPSKNTSLTIKFRAYRAT